MPPEQFEARHVRAIVLAYYRAGVRSDGLFQVPDHPRDAGPVHHAFAVASALGLIFSLGGC